MVGDTYGENWTGRKRPCRAGSPGRKAADQCSRRSLVWRRHEIDRVSLFEHGMEEHSRCPNTWETEARESQQI